MKFRVDINGLRAIAVLAVVFFHFSPDKLPGGFVGVDVFFVISGYLMTSIIFRGFENNNFSFWNFIVNRAKRIVPALLAVSFILLILGYATLGPDAYKMLARHVRDSLLFISNITYKNESGYFDVASNTKFLLHTWSLSVEWQFYIVYPIALLILKRCLSISKLKIVVFSLLMLSLLASVFVTKYQPETAYFMFYTRAWEMLFGGIAFLYPLKSSINNRIRFTLELVGLVIIAISILKINIQTPWPGYIALLPVFGTYLCIVANNNKTILSGYIIEKIGLWSYSIYLIHWPLIVFNNILSWNLSFKKYIVIVLALSFISYQLIEKRRKYKWGLLVSFILVLLMAVYVRSTNGIEQRLNAPNKQLIQGNLGAIEKEWNVYNDGEKYDYVFYGDSFAAQYHSYLAKRPEHMALLFRFECLNTNNLTSHREYCRDNYPQLKKNLAEKTAKTLVIAQAWSWGRSGLKNNSTNESLQTNLSQFVELVKEELLILKDELSIDQIVIVGVNNHFNGAGGPKQCVDSLSITTIYDSFFRKNECEYAPLNNSDYVENLNKLLEEMSNEVNEIQFINPNNAVCKNNQCVQIIEGESIYADGSHFSTKGADIVGKYIFDELEKIK